MEKRRPLNTILSLSALLLAGLVVFLHIHLVKVRDNANPYNFSALNVAEDIKIISKKPHSIEHPEERKVVREYLAYRLRQSGGDVRIFEYDSIESELGGFFDIANIYACFDPPTVTDSTKYLLLVAHYDSRFRQRVLSDTVFSYGAADDGYGIGVALELVRVVDNYRNLWKQGVKILFTDAEEHQMDGMANMIAHDSLLLKGVNLAINIEARGVRGPALLFETSGGNGKLIDFYRNAAKPYGYSLTSLVYGILPNDTDFSLIKDRIPGYNFAVVDNLKFYHTDKDCYANISLESIQHYGEQINPLVKSYLIGAAYGSCRSFVSESDKIFFTVPLLGLFAFSKAEYVILNLSVLAFAVLIFILLLKRTSISGPGMVRHAGMFLLAMFLLLVAGELAASLVSLAMGEPLGFMSLKYFKYDNLLFIGSLALLSLLYLAYLKKKSVDPLEVIAAHMLLLALFSFVAGAAFLENFIYLTPLAAVSLAMLVNIRFGQAGKILLSVALFVTALAGISFFYLLYVTVTVGMLGVLLFLSAPCAGLIIGIIFLSLHPHFHSGSYGYKSVR